jgi:hypothetical protein
MLDREGFGTEFVITPKGTREEYHVAEKCNIDEGLLLVMQSTIQNDTTIVMHKPKESITWGDNHILADPQRFKISTSLKKWIPRE